VDRVVARFLYYPDSGSGIGGAVSDLPEGPFEDVLGVPLVSRTFIARVASGSPTGGTIKIYVDGCQGFTEVDGTLAGACQVANTGGPQSWINVECAVDVSPGVHDLCLRFVGPGGSQQLDLDDYTFR